MRVLLLLTGLLFAAGAGDLVKTLRWEDGSQSTVSVSKSLERYAEAARRVMIVIGEKNVKPQPRRPAHQGTTRIDFAHGWAREMNRNARRYGLRGEIEVQVIPGIGHDSARLTPHCAAALLAAGD